MAHLENVARTIATEAPRHVSLRQQSGTITWTGNKGWNASHAYPTVAYPTQEAIERAAALLRRNGIVVRLTGPKSIWHE